MVNTAILKELFESMGTAGDKIGTLSTSTIDNINSNFGGTLTGRAAILVLTLVAIFFAMKFATKLTRIAIIFIAGVIAVMVISSFFNS